MNATKFLPRVDPYIKPQNTTNGISPKISQLHQIYTQQPKASKQQQNELKKQSDYSIIGDSEAAAATTKLEDNHIPRRLIMDPSGKPRSKNATTTVNIKFEELSKKADNVEQMPTNTRELHLDNKAASSEFQANIEEEVRRVSKYMDSIIDIEDDEINGDQKSRAKECVEVSRKAFDSGRTKKLAFREKQLKGLLKFFENHRTEIEEAIYKDLRKHRQETNISEIELVANDIRHTLIKLKKWVGPQKPKKRLINFLDRVYIYNDPFGVVLIIGAWNYPILLTLGPLVGALAGGNTVILKPSELAPATNKLLSDVLINYLDQDCLQIYPGGSQETMELLKEKFDYIFFTGSSKIGQRVYQAAAKNITPCTLELGGKCPLYIDNTVDMYKTAKRALWGRMLNSGQTCVAPDYILCTKEVQDKFVKESEKVLKQFWGKDPSKSSSLSRIVTENHYRRLLEFMKHEQVAIGGHTNDQELIIGPTILTDVDPQSPIMEEEIFGPIFPIINIKSAQEAIDFINSREKPLALYIFTKNKRVQNMFLAKTSSGGVSINDTISHISTENLPFGGVGLSGLGNYHGKYGFNTFTHKKGVLIKDFGGISEMALSLRYPPYSDKKTSLINIVLQKRRGIYLGFLDKIFVFFLGLGLAFLLQFYFQII